MEYSDYPENLSDMTVEKLNSAYDQQEKVKSLSNDLKNINIQSVIDDIANKYYTVNQLMIDLQKADMKHYDMLQNYLTINNKQISAIEPYIASRQTQMQHIKHKSFHHLCTHYCLSELDLISSICALCSIDVEYMYKQFFYDVLSIRLEILKCVMQTYT